MQGSLGLYGVDTFVTRLSSHLTRMGFEVTLVTPLGRSFVRGGSARSVRLESPGKSRGWWRTFRAASLIHINYALVSLPFLLHPSSRIVPMVYTVHGVPQPEFESEPLFKVGYILEGMTLRHLANRAARVVAISSYVSKLLRDRYGVNAKVIRNGVDTELFYPPSAGLKQRLKSSRGVPDGKQVVLFVGRLHQYKDPLTFVRCIPKVIARNSDAYFVMIGEGPSKFAVQREASRLGVDGAFRLIPPATRRILIEWFQSSDLFVSTSAREMLGIAVLEAMSTGLPVVAPSSGGPPEVLGRSGTLFRPGSHEDLADKISNLLSDKRSAQENGDAARQIVLNDFRWDKIAGQYATLYKDAVRAP